MQTETLTDKQYKILSKKLLKTIGNHYKIIPLNTLKNPHYFLRRPIFITIETEKDIVIASLDDIEAFAYADTEFEAINGLCQEIVNVYEDLNTVMSLLKLTRFCKSLFFVLSFLSVIPVCPESFFV